MATIQYLADIDLGGNQLANAVIHVLPTTSAPAHAAGKIYYDSTLSVLRYSDGTNWTNVSGATGDIEGVTAGTRLSGGGTSGTVTLNLDTATINEIVANTAKVTNVSTNLSYTASTGVMASSDGTNATIPDATTSVKGLMSGTDKTKLDGVAANANNYVHPTTAGNKHIPTGGAAGQFLKYSASGTAVWAADNDTNDDVSVANLKTRLAGGFALNAVSIGDSDDTVTIPGNLIVTGTTTTEDVTTLTTSNGVVFEGSVADANEAVLKAGSLTADRTITLPDATGTVALTSDISGTNSGTNTGDEPDASTTVKGIIEIATTAEALVGTDTARAVTAAGLSARSYKVAIGDGSTTAIVVTHSLNTRDVMVQLYDSSSYDTVHAQVVRTNTTQITCTFNVAPGSGDITVLVTKIQ